VGQAVKLNL